MRLRAKESPRAQLDLLSMITHRRRREIVGPEVEHRVERRAVARRCAEDAELDDALVARMRTILGNNQRAALHAPNLATIFRRARAGPILRCVADRRLQSLAGDRRSLRRR